jgi:hypothetical protein
MRVGLWIVLGCMIVTGHYYFCGPWCSSRVCECCEVHFEALYGRRHAVNGVAAEWFIPPVYYFDSC